MISALLDVLIGVLLLFTVLSIMVSAVNEYISNFLNLRARNLWRFIDTWITNEAQGISLKTEDFYRATAPTAVIDDGKMKKSALPAYIKAADFSAGVLNMLRPYMGNPDPTVPISLEGLREATAKLNDDSPLKKILLTCIDKAEGDINRARWALENWYDGAMDRISGLYKKNVQRVVFGIGLVLAVTLNIDTINFVNALLRNPALRESIAAQSALTAAQISERATMFSAAGLQPDFGSQITGFYELQQLDLPIGWVNDMARPKTADFAAWLGYTIQKFFGLLITAFAVTQGAPFWFDLLNKVTNLRAGGRPPEKSPEMPVSPYLMMPRTPGSPDEGAMG